MKKVNGILILITALSIATLALVILATGVFKKPEETVSENENPLTATPATPREKYEDEYEMDPDQAKEIAVVNVIEHLTSYGSPEEIYTYSFQQAVRSRIRNIANREKRTEDKPLVIRNPFCTDTQSLYVYFETDYPCAVGYSVHVSKADSDAEDFGGYVVASKQTIVNENGEKEEVNTSLIHEFSITGIQPGVTNTITIRLVDENGVIRMRRFYYDFSEGLDNKYQEKLVTERATKTVIVDEETLETATVNVSPEELSDGMFAVFRGPNGYVPYMIVYDNDGYARMEVPLIDTTATKVEVRDGLMFLQVSESKLVAIDSIGEVVKIFSSDEYKFSGNWCFDEDGNILMIASDRSRFTVNDRVCVLDMKTESVSELIDMGQLLTEYKEEVSKKNWLGLSSISYTGDNMIVLSADSINTLIKVRRIYNGPRIVYLAGTGEDFKDLESKKLFFNLEGEFTFPTSVTDSGYEKYDKIRESRSYVWVLDQNKDYEYEREEEHFGYYTKLMIDDEERTVRKMTDSIVLPEITKESKLITNGENKILVTGLDSVFREYDKDFNLITTFTYKVPNIVKTIEQQDADEDDPPPDDTVRYIGIGKFSPLNYLFIDDVIVYVGAQ